jgi:CRP-like cAMP-binding protein
MMNPLIRKLEQRDRLSAEERRVLETAIARIRDFRRDEDIVRDGDHPSDSNLILDGFACRYKMMADGRRQITAIHVTGDFCDLHSFLLKTMDHAVAALTPCRIAIIPHEALREITEAYPHLTRLLWLTTLIDAAIQREWIIGMGRRTALGRVAHLLCELFLRLEAAGLTEHNACRLPVTQVELGDAVGLSSVHVNRVVQQLRAEGLITWRGDTLAFEDWQRLAAVAEFEPAYLYLGARAQ